MAIKQTEKAGDLVDELFNAGAHFGFVKARRHPSAKPFIFGSKNKIEIFDLTLVEQELKKALSFIEDKGKEGAAGQKLSMPYVNGRWIGGTLTNYPEIKRRIAKLEELTTQKEKGELGKYTKKERLLIDREIDNLTLYFGSLSGLKGLPKVLVIVDPKKESIAVAEAKKLKIPVVAIAGSDNNLYSVDFAVPANDSSQKSINIIIEKMIEAYEVGKANQKKEEPAAVPSTI